MGKLKGSLCYQIGAMDLAPDGGVGWREEITPFLQSRQIGILNPCLKPTFEAFEDDTTRKRVFKLKKEKKYGEVKEIMKQICFYDLRMVDMSSFLILYIDINIHTCGSYWEAAHAIQQQKPLLVICKQGIEHIPNWIFGLVDLSMVFNSIEECCNYLSKIDSGEISPSFKKWKFFDFSKIF